MRSTTAMPSVDSSVRSWRGESSSSQAITFASSVAASACSSSSLPEPR